MEAQLYTGVYSWDTNGCHSQFTSMSRFFVSRRKRCKDFSANTALKKGDRRKRTSDRARTRDLHSFAELQPHEPSVPAANPLSPIALCTNRRSAAIQRPLEDLRLEAGIVCDDKGLSGQQRVA